MSNEGINRPDPFLASGISLGKPTTNSTEISTIDNVFFLDENGELQFRDAWLKNQVDVNGNPIDTVSLKDLWTRINGVKAINGQLFFQDSSTKRAYSLKELVQAYTETKNRFVQGGIWWIGRTSITNAECENIIVNVNGDPNISINEDNSRIFTKNNNEYPPNAQGTKVFSVDKYILDNISNFNPSYKVNEDGDFRWHDVPSLEILVPHVDTDKITTIISKLSVRILNTKTPILFRLYNETTNEVLDKVAVGNSSREPIEQQPILTFSGRLDTFEETIERLNCQCPTGEQMERLQDPPPNRIKVQFYVDDILEDDIFDQICNDDSNVVTLQDSTTKLFNALERRVFGSPNALTDEPITNANIDCIIYDVSSEDKIGRKVGSVDFNKQDLYVVNFDTPFSSADYSISISCDKNINMFYTNKKSTGFTIRAEKKFTGSVDWTATKLKFEGNA